MIYEGIIYFICVEKQKKKDSKERMSTQCYAGKRNFKYIGMDLVETDTVRRHTSRLDFHA